MSLKRYVHYLTRSDIEKMIGFFNTQQFITWIDRNKLTCINDEYGKNVEAYFTYDVEIFIKLRQIKARQIW